MAEKVNDDCDINTESSYYVHHSDGPGTPLVSNVLIGDNYMMWRKAMMMALSAKNKLGFVDGSIAKPDSPISLKIAWERCNNLVQSWILNSIHKDLLASVIHAKTAAQIWSDLEARFSQANGPRIYQIKPDRYGLRYAFYNIGAGIWFGLSSGFNIKLHVLQFDYSDKSQFIGILHHHELLCSWNPRKRPTAAEVLQHYFFQSCFYIPPSLRAKALTPKQPSVGIRGSLEHNSFARVVENLPNAKPVTNFSTSRICGSLNAGPLGVQRRAEFDDQDNKVEKANKSAPRQPRYRPPMRNSPSKVAAYVSLHESARGVSDAVSNALNRPSQLAFASDGHQRSLIRPALKAGGWHSRPDLFGQSQGMPVHVGRTYPRKVAG